MSATAFLVQRIGPYHHARLSAFAARGNTVAAIEFRPDEAVYAWNAVPNGGGYARFPARSPEELCQVLEELPAEVVVCTGYSDPEVHQAAAWALSRRVPLVTCSDSTYDDEPRSWPKEALKRRVVAAFDSALVAGRRAFDYLGTLGMDGGRCFRPWDVVDNAHFARDADVIPSAAGAARSKLKLPEHYFLCVARFIAKKNLAGLIQAFSRYLERAGADAWSLVLSGSGPLETELRAQVASAGLAGRVHFPGFLQYSDLPACYRLAGAFVLPSTSDQWGLVVNEAMASGLPVLVSSRCGCVPDLVRDGENGFTFDPENTSGLAACLARVAGFDPFDRERMGRRSRELVAAFTPDTFADGLSAAVACARRRVWAQKPWQTRLLLRLLARRRGRDS